ncbi:phosphotransferase family protein [Salinisphaera sp. PC39]|uniref:phosphotransferase family protein n=1 Tax=Salinisphaera sp. PC39 TaxID=1304156 RepID=UPI00333E3744
MSDPIPDLEPVRVWMDEQGLGRGRPFEEARLLAGGTQNVMVRFRRGDRSYVLRRGPRHTRATTDKSLLREIRVLEALADTAVPHPALIAACPDRNVLGDSVFYLMAPVDGLNAVNELSARHRESAAVRHDMGLRMVDALAALHAVDPEQVGLGDMGHPDGFHERQVRRWLSELDAYNELSGYEGHAIPGLAQVADWLDNNLPRHPRPGLMHGDFHVANVMFEHGGPDVAAIVDWEMCTVGDPLLDLGWLLSLWREPGQDTDLLDSALSKAGGMATPDELIERYASHGVRDVTELDWYRVLACFKLGIILEGTYARSRAGKAPPELGTWMRDRTTRLFERAHALIAASGRQAG